MGSFSREIAEKILMNQIDSKTLSNMVPEVTEAILLEFTENNPENDVNKLFKVIDTHKKKAQYAVEQIRKSNMSEKSLKSFLPDIIKARIAIYLLEQMNLVAQSGKTSGAVRFKLWDGYILQKLLFEKKLDRKPASLFGFRLFWPFIIDKKILLPLVNKKGIYCFYTRKLVKELVNLIGTTTCVEVGAGDGTLTRFLNDAGVKCLATDDYSWENYIAYPKFVEKLGAKEALAKYKPETVVCSWPPPQNPFEKLIFNTDSVKTYIVIGSANPLFSGNHQSYSEQKGFTMVHDKKLSSYVLPPSKDNVIYIFTRNR
jgi:hypothetical protein